MVLAFLTVAACGSDDTGSTTSGAGASGSTAGPGGGDATSSSTGAASSNGGGGSGTGGSGGGASSTGAGAGGQGFTTVFTIVMENHNYEDVVGSANAPYINQLIGQYGLATNYMDSGTHPSLPNYLYMVSGDPQYVGFVDLDPTFYPFPVAGDNLGNQLQGANIAWRSYQESMGTACKLSASGNYAPKHDPFLYFTNIQTGPNDLCATTNVDYTSFAADLAAGTYKYMWITPNLLNDGHDPAGDPVQGLKQCDTWLSTELPKILASATYQAGGVVFLTWDEGESGASHIPMIIISPKIKSAGYQSAQAYNHASYLATIEEIFALPKLGAAATAQSLMEFFQ